jgi:hypothetical protein
MNEVITGLALVVALACLGLVWGFIMLSSMIWRLMLWAKSQEYPPARGQVWNQHGGRLYIVDVRHSGKDTLVSIRSYAYNQKNEWDESLSAWKARVKANHLYLMPRESDKFLKTLTKGNEQ